MAKSLGQIHSVNTTITGIVDNTRRERIDIPGELTEQLQRLVRQGCFYKLVGLDLTVNSQTATGEGGKITGVFRYFAPTQGRCAAYRAAFKTMAEQMSIQGVSMRDNKMYDFRVDLNNETTGLKSVLKNQATLDGTLGLSLINSDDRYSVFATHNNSQKPQFGGTADEQFTEGFNTLLQSGAGNTDFVLNDSIMYTGNEHFASNQYEEIPFEVAFGDQINETAVTSFQWRPDPALYIAIMTGQLEMVLDNVYVDDNSISLQLNCNFMVSGWKSIMGDPDKKKKSSRKRMTSKKARK
jgi:hypothetical protein